jgi:two-component system, NtrC family, sensor histidine kinase HydH
MLVALLAGSLAERLRAAGGQVVEAQARADQAEREASLGRLATALAHEIRNPLGSIAGSVRLLADNPDLSEEDQQLCDIIYRESRRLEELVGDMLKLAKPRRAEPVVVDVVTIAREVVELAAHSGRGVADVAVVYRGEDELKVLADAGLLRQLLWNLVRNAVQASRPGESVVVSVGEEGGRGTIEVVDRGSGLTEEAKTHLFDAFFTTRAHGTGIGLAVIKRIADDHGWEVGVRDTDGGGATFWVKLGALQDNAEVGESPDVGKPWTLFPKAGP